jgi:predicted DNA-binding protein
MSEGKPIPVRLSPDIIRRLDAVAKKTGMSTRASIIKICVTGFLDYFERTGMAGLPLNYREIIQSLDGRTRQFQQNIHVVAEQSVVNGDLVNHAPGAGPGGKGRRRKGATTGNRSG